MKVNLERKLFEPYDSEEATKKLSIYMTTKSELSKKILPLSLMITARYYLATKQLINGKNGSQLVEKL